MRYRTHWIAIALATVVGLSTGGWAQTARPGSAALAKAVEAIENLDALRSGLAGTLEGKGVASR